MLLSSLNLADKSHWELHLNAVLKSDVSLETVITELLQSSRELPRINHPSYVHDWFENPTKREEIEGWTNG